MESGIIVLLKVLNELYPVEGKRHHVTLASDGWLEIGIWVDQDELKIVRLSDESELQRSTDEIVVEIEYLFREKY